MKELAMKAGIRGYLCLPVYETDWHFCIGVLEIFTIMDGSFCFDDVIEKVSASLKEVGLRCCDVFRPFDPKHLNQLENGPAQYEIAVNEIQNVLDVLCMTYKIPFAQTWVATSCGSSEESFISKAEMGSYTPDRVSSFQRDCKWFHLRKGQGIVWKAFLSGTCFCRDLTKLSIVDYSLVLSARKVDFTGGFAICLQSTYTGNLIAYIIELFLPPNETIYRRPWIFLTSLLDTMKQLLKTFKLSTGQKIGSDLPVAVLQSSEDDPIDPFVICKTMHADEGLKNQTNIAQRTPTKPLIFDTGPKGSGPEHVNIKENTVSSSYVSKLPHNRKMELPYDTTSNNRSIKQNTEQIMLAKNGTMRTLSLGEAVSTKALEKVSVKRSMSNNMNPAPDINVGPPRKKGRIDCSSKEHIVEVIQQSSSSCGPPEEDPIPLSSCSSVATPMQNQGIIVPIVLQSEAAENPIKMTVKASYKDDLIKFEFSLSAGMSELKNEMIKRLKLDDGCFEIKYTDENKCLIILDSDATLQNCINTVRSLKKTIMRLSIQPIRTQTTVSNECIMIVKASYGDDIIKFKLSLSSGMMNLKDEVTKRLKLEAGSFVVKYLDEDRNEVLVDGDAALTKYMSTLLSMGINTVKISLQPKDQQA